MKQTILGSGGGIGLPLAQELKNFTDDIRLVSRNPKKVNDTDELFPSDLKDFVQVDKVIEGSAVVFVIIGFTFKRSQSAACTVMDAAYAGLVHSHEEGIPGNAVSK